MRLAALHHTEMAREHATFQAAVSSTTELVLRHSPSNIARVEVVSELAVEIQKLDGRRVKLEQPATRICDLLLRPPPDQAWLVDHLDEAARQLREELAGRQEAEAELEALWCSTA
jgi:hypothetical protein